MEHVKVQTLCLIVAIGLTVTWSVQSAPLGLGGPGGPGGFGLPQSPSMPGQQQQIEQPTPGSTDLKFYFLDEENAGYFRGEWYAAVAMMINCYELK